MPCSVVDQATHGLRQRIVVLRDAVGGKPHFGGHLFALGVRFGLDDAGRVAHRRGTGRHRLGHHRVAAHLGTIAHGEAPQHFGARSHHDVLSQGRMALFALVERGASQGHPVVDGAAIADFGRLTNHHAHAVVDEHAMADLRARVDLDTREPAVPVRDPAPQPLEAPVPAGMGQPVKHHRMKPRVAGDHLPARARRRVALQDAIDVGFHSGKHVNSLALCSGCGLQHGPRHPAQDVDFGLGGLRPVQQLMQSGHQFFR